MKLLDLFSGIGGFHLGLEQSGFEFDWIGYSEIDKYASKQYKRRFPNATELGDVTTIQPKDLPSDITILCGGFPCQAFSIAGKRQGFNDTRGTLFFEIARILRYFKETGKPIPYFILENVKGLLNHDNGQTFATIYKVLTEIGYTIECQLLNTKWFLPQNRERIYIVGYIGEGSRSKIFPIRESDRVFEQSRKKERQRSSEYCSTITSNLHKGVHAMGETYVKVADFRNDEGLRIRKDGNSPCLSTRKHSKTDISTMPPLIINKSNKNYKLNKKQFITRDGRDSSKPGICGTLRAGRILEIGYPGKSIRRLTPTEAERLQGFPDGWTDGQSDTQRYKQLGNAVSVPVVKVIGEKIWRLIQKNI